MDIGERVRQCMPEAPGHVTQASIAETVGMSPDALSRSLNGHRAFSSLELARIAELLGVDVYWLITGDPDPLAVRFAARHDFDRGTGQYQNPGAGNDEAVLDRVALAYRQALNYRTPSTTVLPPTPGSVRAALGESPIRALADRIEDRLGIDVMRIQGLGTDYSLTIADRRVILLKSEPHWFRSNWSLAHELGHFALGHHGDGRPGPNQETAAHRFAAELLLPATEMRQVEWESIEGRDLALLLWEWGVSTEALRNRLANLSISLSEPIRAFLQESTIRFLRRFGTQIESASQLAAESVDPISDRMSVAAERRVPRRLLAALLDGVIAGPVNPGALAWLLEVDAEDLLDDEPLGFEPTTDELIAMLD